MSDNQYYPQPARDDLAFRMFAAWLNCDPDKVPTQFMAWTCPQTRTAWGRVAEAAKAALQARADAAEIAKLQARNAALVEALRGADVEILENVRAFEGVASDIRAAIEAARGE